MKMRKTIYESRIMALYFKVKYWQYCRKCAKINVLIICLLCQFYIALVYRIDQFYIALVYRIAQFYIILNLLWLVITYEVVKKLGKRSCGYIMGSNGVK